MNSKVHSFIIAVAMMLAGVTLTSCSSSDDTPSTSKARKAAARVMVYFADDMLNYYDVTCTVDGTPVVLTRSNTVEDVYTINALVEKIDYNVRKYTTPVTTFTHFPDSMVVTAQATVKAGVDLKTVESMDLCLYLHSEIDNDNDGKWSALEIKEGSFSFIPGVDFSRMPDATLAKYTTRSRTLKIVFDAADQCKVSRPQ